MRPIQALTFAIMATTPSMALPKDPLLSVRDNVNCYSSGYPLSVEKAKEEARSVCEPMSGFYPPNEHIKHCRDNDVFSHINFEIKRTDGKKWEMSYDSCVGYFTKIIDRCGRGGTDKDRDQHWWLKVDPEFGGC